ncbi:MAG: TlyA family RNA methyltransferase [Myxococcota bacterium]
MSRQKERLDTLLVSRGLCETRSRAQSLILAGRVVVDDHRIDKAGTRVSVEAQIRVKGDQNPYVSRGGLKLEAALKAWSLDVAVDWAVDLGASTGGFVDCLLQHGCCGVIAVDVGYGQLHPKLREDPRVHNLERTNARYLRRADLPLEAEQNIALIVTDLSFISVEKMMDTVVDLLDEGGSWVCLVKPQFEVGREKLPKGGVVRDHELRQASADRVCDCAAQHGFYEWARLDCPVHGPKGNIEILMWLRKSPPPHAG